MSMKGPSLLVDVHCDAIQSKKKDRNLRIYDFFYNFCLAHGQVGVQLQLSKYNFL